LGENFLSPTLNIIQPKKKTTGNPAVYVMFTL